MDAAPAARTILAPAPQGAATAIAAIVRQHNRRLFRVARSILKDDAEAEDVVQETWLRAFAGFDALRDPASLPGWLVRITTNEALSRLRRRRGMVVLADIAEDVAGDAIPPMGLPFLPGQQGPEEAAMQAELRTVLERAIDSLPAHFRMAIVACDVEQMTVEEAADALGLYAVTVRTRLFRARRMLRRTLGAEFAAVLPDAYPCAGARCDRILAQVLGRLALRAAPGLSACDQEETP